MIVYQTVFVRTMNCGYLFNTKLKPILQWQVTHYFFLYINLILQRPVFLPVILFTHPCNTEIFKLLIQN